MYHVYVKHLDNNLKIIEKTYNYLESKINLKPYIVHTTKNNGMHISLTTTKPQRYIIEHNVKIVRVKLAIQ